MTQAGGYVNAPTRLRHSDSDPCHHVIAGIPHPTQKPVWLPPPCGEGWGGGFVLRKIPMSSIILHAVFYLGFQALDSESPFITPP
jgi:hypothetical protein